MRRREFNTLIGGALECRTSIVLVDRSPKVEDHKGLCRISAAVMAITK
jgi:hypothetical protein